MSNESRRYAVETMTNLEQAPDELRGRLRRMWGGVAPGWGKHAAFVDARAAAMTETILDLARLEPGMRVLELARRRAGRGGPDWRGG
jgi:hypothetical protein